VKKVKLFCFIILLMFYDCEIFGDPLFSIHYSNDFFDKDYGVRGALSVEVLDRDITYSEFEKALMPEGELGRIAENIVHLRIYDCDNLEALPDLSKLKNLRHFLIEGCPNLRNLIMPELVLLEYFEVLCCHGLKVLDVSELHELRDLRIEWAIFNFHETITDFLRLREIGQPKKHTGLLLFLPENLVALRLGGCRGLYNLSQIGGLEHLEELMMSDSDINEIPEWLLRVLPNLRVLCLICTPLVVGVGKSLVKAAARSVAGIHEDVVRLIDAIRKKEKSLKRGRDEAGPADEAPDIKRARHDNT